MNWIRNTLIVLATLTVSLGATEFGLRFFFPEKTSSEIRNHTDPYFPRHIAGTYADLRRNTLATFDHEGFRLNPNKCTSSVNATRVLIVGDSNIAAHYLNDTETLGARLTQISSEFDNCIDVDSFGVSGFGPDQNFFAMKALTEARTYDYVIFSIFADNDAGDLIRNNYFSNGSLVNDGYCYMQKPLLEQFVTYQALRAGVLLIFGEMIGYGQPTASNDGFECAAGINSGTIFHESMIARAKLDWQLHNEDKRQVYMADRYDIEFSCRLNLDAISYANDAFSHIVTEGKELSENRGFQIIYLLQPSKEDVTRAPREILNKVCPNYSPRALTKFFAKNLKDQLLVNLFNEFDGCSECYFTYDELGDDNHWSEYGINIAANRLFKLIRSTARN